MRFIRFLSIAFLTIFNLFNGVAGFYQLLFPDYLEREIEDNPVSGLSKVQIFLCFLTSFTGFLVICTKHKAFTIFVSQFNGLLVEKFIRSKSNPANPFLSI